MDTPRLSQASTGFTVLELLVCVTVVAMLIACLLPAIQNARESARRVQCASQLRQLGIALHAHASSRQRFPAGWAYDSSKVSALGWATQILPYLDDQPEWGRVDFRRLLASAEGGAMPEALPVFICPSDMAMPKFTLYAEDDSHSEGGQSSTTVLVELPSANYAGVFGESDPDAVAGNGGEGAFIEARGVRLREFRLGTSKTLMVGERTARKLPTTWLGFAVDGEDAQGRVTGNAYLGPNRDDADECEFDSRHFDGVNFLWVDGHVRFMSNSIEPLVYRRSAHRS